MKCHGVSGTFHPIAKLCFIARARTRRLRPTQPKSCSTGVTFASARCWGDWMPGSRRVMRSSIGPAWCRCRPPRPLRLRSDMNPCARHFRQRALPVALGSLVAACGAGSGPSAPPAPPPSSVTLVRVSQPSTFPAGCDGVAPSGTLYTDTVAEPYLVVNPTSPANLIGAWQQNRWSDGGAQGLMLAASFDGGATWTLSRAAFSRCTGGNAGNRGDYARASDVWLAFSADGAAYALSLSFSGLVLAAGSSSAMLVARSQDGGMSWGAPTALIQDGAQSFNDKGSITSD